MTTHVNGRRAVASIGEFIQHLCPGMTGLPAAMRKHYRKAGFWPSRACLNLQAVVARKGALFMIRTDFIDCIGTDSKGLYIILNLRYGHYHDNRNSYNEGQRARRVP